VALAVGQREAPRCRLRCFNLSASRSLSPTYAASSGDRTLAEEGYNRRCRMRIEFSTVRFDESRDTFVDAALPAE
jgi:hypothetical protein